METKKTENKKWTQFMDMHSGGGNKEGSYEHIYIEAPEEEAKIIFYNRFGHSPERVSCTCCGEDYSISEEEGLDQITGYERGCKYDEEKKCYIEEKSKTSFMVEDFCSVEKYGQKETVLIIHDKDIKDEERGGEVPESGYVWVE